MANDKKFIVKNGLLTQETVVIGSTNDNGVNKLQVTGSSFFTQSSSATPTINITNTGGTSNSIIAQFTGDSDSLRVVNIGTGDYAIVNSQQNNGIRFYDDTAGVEILYNGSVDINFNSSGIDFKREPTYNGAVFWNANNDGSGSGLDADLLDGLDSLQFLRSDQDDTFDGNLIITGDLTVQGTTTTINTETILLADNIITLNSNYTGSTPTENAGIEVERGTLTNSSLVWDETNDWWKLISAGTDLGRIITTADEGSGNGFDADTVDGLQAAQFLRSDADDTATGNIIFQGTITVGNNTNAGATIIMDGEAGNRYIYSNNNEIGFLNSAFAYAAYSDGSNNWRVLNDTYAKRFIDSDNNTYLLDPAGTSVLNTIDLEGQIRHNGDTDTYITFNAADNFQVVTGGSQRLLVNNTSVTAVNQMRAPIYYDSDDINYYGDFAATSRLNDILLVGEIIADGDTNTYLDFNAADSFQIVTGGSARLTVTNTAVTASVNMVAPQFVDSDNNAYYGDFASTSVMNNISLEGNLQHNGDTDTYITFPASNQIGFYTASTERFLITDTYAQSSNDLRAPRFVDSANVNKFADPAGTSEFNSANFYSAAANNAVNIGISATERFNIDVTDGQGFIRYIQDETDNTDHSVNFQIISTSTGLNRFNFNKNIDVGTNTVSGAFGVFSSGVYAPVFYDNDNELFYADFNNTGVSINAAGTIRAGDGALATPTYTFGSDTNTGMYRFAADTIGFSAGGNDEFRIYTTYAQAVGQMRAPIFYDSDNTAYYGNFADSSVMNTIGIDSDLFHNGDTDTKLSFGTDVITLTTANVTRLTINTTALTSTLNTYAPRFYTDDYLVHTGDENTYIGFNALDTFGVWTNGANRLSITSTEATFSVPTYATTFYTNDYLIHNGDTDTYLGFDANDNFGIWTAGTQRVDINASGNVGIGTVAQDERLEVAGNVQANEYYGPTDKAFGLIPDGTSYLKNVYVTQTAAGASGYVQIGEDLTNGPYVYLFKNSSGRSINLQTDNNSWIDGLNFGIGTTTPGAKLSVRASTALGNNPFLAANKLIELGDSNSVDFSIRGDGLRNTWAVIESAAQFVFADSAATILLSMDASTGDVIVGDQQAQYATSDGVPTFISSIDANKLHVNGSVQLNGINNALSIYAADAANTAINEATFLAVNELGFSAGGGFYMNDTTNIRVRNNKTLTSTGDFQAARFVDVSNVNYFADPAGTSVMNRIGIDDYIQHNGDTDSYFGFAANDTFRVFTGNTQRLNIDNDSADFAVDVYAPRYYDSNNNAYYVDPASTSIMSRIDIDDYIRHRGDENNYFGFAANDTFRVFTSNVQRFNVDDDSADFSVDVYAPRYFDSNNNNFYGDFAGTSVFARVTMPQNTVGVSFSGTSNAPDYYIGQTTGDTDIWKIYGESPSGTDTSSLIISIEGDRDSNEQIRFRFKNSTTFATTDSLVAYHDYVQATNSFRAPIFEDSNNTAFYIDPASTSVTNTMRANQFQVDGSTYLIDSPAGNFGSIRVEGAADGTWAGYAIRDDWVFAADGATNAGIYNDTDNEWAIQFVRNAGTELLFDGVKQAETENGYFLATNQMRAPIYYAPSSTSYWLDLDVANGTDALRIPSQINRQDFATGSGSTNIFLTAQDSNHFIWNTATNWGIFWATATDAAYRYAPFGDNMITFVGAGNTRAAIDLDNGNAYFQGEVTAANFRINGGNEDLGLLKTYGSGLGDTMLFDGTEYWEKRVILPMQGAENSSTTVTAEFVKNNDGPFASSYVLQTAAYRDFYSDYIPVEPGEEIYGEIAVRYISGTGGLLYYGVERFDKDKLPIASNNGTTYFVVSAVNYTGAGWTTYRGHTTIPTSHTPFNGSDGGGVKYVRIRVLMNHSAGGALREFGPPILKRTNHLSNIVTQNIDAEGDVYANRYYDRNDPTFYVDPASTSVMNIIDASNFRDRDNTARFMNPATGGNVQGTWDWNNGSIINLNDISFADPGPNEGIHWAGGNNWRIYESPDDLTTNSAGNLQILYNNNQVGLRLNTSGDGTFGRYAYAQRFYDSDNNSFYLDPASTSELNQARFSNATPLRFTTTSTALFDHESDSTPVAFRMNKGGNTITDSSDYGVLQLSRTNHNNAATSAGAGLYFTLKDSAGTLREYAGIYGRKTVAGTGGGELVFTNYNRNALSFLNASFFSHNADIRAPRFTDIDDTAFYVDPASTSVTNIVRANQFQVDGSTYLIDSASGDYGSIQVSGDKNGWAGYSINGQWNFMSSGPGAAGIYNDTNNQWAILAAQQSDVQIYFNGTWEERSRSAFMEARGSYRAPIFYDSNDTNFYVDPNSTSRITNLIATGYITAEGFEVLTTNLQTSSGNLGWNLNGDFAMQAIYGNHNALNQGNVYNAALFKGASWTLYGFNGSAWVDLGTTPNLTNGKGKNNWGGTNLPRGYTEFIIDCGNSFGYQFMSAFTLTHSTSGNSMDIYFEKSTSAVYNSGTWTTMASAIGVSSWPGGTSVKFNDVVGASFPPYVRLRIVPNFSHPSNAISLGQFFVSGAYGGANSLFDWDNNQNVTFNGDITASRLIDRDNNGRFVNPNGASQIDALTINGGNILTFNTSTGIPRGYIQSTDTNDAHLIIATGGGEDISFRDGGVGGDWNMIIRGDGNTLVNNFLYATRYYDRNDTAYYLDPNSTSILLDVNARNITLSGEINATNYAQLYGVNYTLSDPTASGSRAQVVPEGLAIYSGYSSGTNRPHTYDITASFNLSGRAFEISADWVSGTGTPLKVRSLRDCCQGWSPWVDIATSTRSFSNTVDLRAPIFYDTDNTGRFLDPASTSQLNQVVINGQSTMATQQAWVASDYGHGVYGLYSPQRYQHVWSMGTAYNLPADGTSTGLGGNLYGLAWAYNPDFGTAGTNAQAKAGLNHQLLLMMNGTTFFAAGNGMWTSGIATSTNSFRAPIFYDTDNTAYYFNGASINDTRFEGVNARTMAMMSLSGQTRSSKELYAARPRNTTDTNYWTGAMGWGTVDMNTVADWGSGFIDSWGSPANAPVGSTHWVGVQALHYTNGTARYGWQLVGGANSNLRLRNSWPAFGAWRTVPVLDVNDNAGGAMYAGIYYDSDNTGFYADPSGSSNFNQDLRTNEFYARGWFRNDAVGTGHYNQQTGVHSYSRNAQEWRLAGNNSANAMNLRGLANYDAVSRFWIHGATDGYQGFLNDAGQWVLRITHSDGLSPGIQFREEANETWIGNPGSDVGQIVYHANRFYIASGSNSDRIVQFRRDGTDVSWIGNDGVFNGTATSARYADLAERYEADDIYEAGTVLGIGGDKEVTLYQPGMPLAGAVSAKPAYRMNDKDYDSDNSIESKMNPFVALKGRIPVKINGSAKKGQWIIADKDGKGRAVDYGSDVNKHEIIGVALSNGEGEVEVKI